jgi:hypothetical protein
LLTPPNISPPGRAGIEIGVDDPDLAGKIDCNDLNRLLTDGITGVGVGAGTGIGGNTA